MPNDAITIQIDMSKTENEVTTGATQSADGHVRIVMSSESAQSIDQCEHALFAVNSPAIREAFARHFSEVSRQEAEACEKKPPRPLRSMEKEDA